MNAIHGAGFNRLLDSRRTVPVLTNRAGAPQVGLDGEGIASHVSAVSAANANSFINPNGFLGKGTPQNRFHSSGLMILKR
jgi:hypothetical protein